MIAAPLTLLPFPEYAVGLVILNASRFICVCLNAQFSQLFVTSLSLNCDMTAPLPQLYISIKKKIEIWKWVEYSARCSNSQLGEKCAQYTSHYNSIL